MKLAKILGAKHLSYALIVTLLSACGSGSSGGGGKSDGSNAKPTLDLSLIENPIVAGNDKDDECQYLAPDALGVVELRCEFSETTRFLSEDGDELSYWELDLTKGIVDADPLDALSVTDFVWLFTGPDCTREDSYTEQYPDECKPNLPEGASEIEEEALKEFRRKQKEGLPKFTRDKYGFRLTFNGVVITPNTFVPLLKNTERAEFALAYKVSDGTDTIDRILRVIINGQSTAPEIGTVSSGPDFPCCRKASSTLDGGIFFPPLKDGSDVLPIVVNLIDDVQDLDAIIQEVIEAEIGKLENMFGDDYQPEVLKVVNAQYVGSSNDLASVDFFIKDNKAIHINSGQFALAPGESVDLNFSYDVVDGDVIAASTGTLSRMLTLTVVGSDTTAGANNPIYFDSDISATYGPDDGEILTDRVIKIDLKDRVADPEGIAVLISSLVDNGLGERFGIDISKAFKDGTISIDPQVFYGLEEGESEELQFQVQYSDGTVISATRNITLTVKGVNRNILAKALDDLGNKADYGFESGAFGGIGGWVFDKHDAGEDAITFTSEAANLRSGAFSLASAEGAMAVLLTPENFPQGKLYPYQPYFVRYTAKSSNQWADIDAFLYKNNDTGNRINDNEILKSSPAGTKDWIDHYHFFSFEPSDATVNTLFGLSLGNGNGNAVVRDDVEIVPYVYDRERDYVEGADFETGRLGKWTVLNAADGNAVVGDEGKFTGEYGLSINTAERTADSVILSFNRDSFPEGAIVNSGKYRVQMDIQHKNWTKNPATAIPVRFINADDPSQKIEKLAYVKDSWKDISLVYNVATEASDAMVDWSTVPVEFQIVINQADAEINIDNIRVYRIP